MICAKLLLGVVALAQVPYAGQTTPAAGNTVGACALRRSGDSLQLIGLSPGYPTASVWNLDGGLVQSLQVGGLPQHVVAMPHEAPLSDALLLETGVAPPVARFWFNQGFVGPYVEGTGPGSGAMTAVPTAQGERVFLWRSSSGAIEEFTVTFDGGAADYTPRATWPVGPAVRSLLFDAANQQLFVAVPSGVIRVSPDGGAEHVVSVDAGNLGMAGPQSLAGYALRSGRFLLLAGMSDTNFIAAYEASASGTCRFLTSFTVTSDGGIPVAGPSSLCTLAVGVEGYPAGVLAVASRASSSGADFKFVSLVDLAAETGEPLFASGAGVSLVDAGLNDAGIVDGGRPDAGAARPGGTVGGGGNGTEEPQKPCGCSIGEGTLAVWLLVLGFRRSRQR